MIVLDPIQALALRRAASDPVTVAGRPGSGKSVLANAIAAEAARAGKTCLLIGTSELLDRPLGFSFVREIHRVLADRARIDYVAGAPMPAPVAPASAIEARARSNPDAARAAALLLRKARELAGLHGLTPAEIESSASANRGRSSTTLNALSLAAQDAARIADILWTGNARAGRTFKDVDEVIAGRGVDVPPDDEALNLIRANDADYEAGIAKIVLDQQEADEESAVSKAVGALLRPRSSDRSLAEYHKHAAFMAHTIGSAISIIRRHGNLKAALAASNGNDAAKAIEYFMRMRPDQGAVTAVRTFEAALHDYRHDSALLEPFVKEFGSRPLGSFGGPAAQRPGAVQPDVGRLIQLLREARYASRHLHGHLGSLRTSLPRPAFERLMNSPIEEACEVLEAPGTTPDPRARAADETRQLRDLFASTGFGDLLNAPEDFADQIERISGETQETAAEQLSGPSYSSSVLDLLLDLTSLTERPANAEWPAAVKRVATPEAALAALAERRFDAVVIDDALAFPAEALAEIQKLHPTVHRLGVAESDAAIPLEVPHRQADAEVACAASGEPNRWLGKPGSFGVVVRVDETLNSNELSAAADRLADELRREGCSASASRSQPADVVVAAFDELHDADIAAAAQRAAHGVVVICRKDLRTPQTPAESPQSADAKAAQALGWQVRRVATEGTVLQKDGRVAALVDERALMSAHDETVADVMGRLRSLGWDPLISWSDAERSPADLAELLAARARPLVPSRFRIIAEAFDLRGPPPNGGGPGPDGGGKPHDAEQAAGEHDEAPAGDNGNSAEAAESETARTPLPAAAGTFDEPAAETGPAEVRDDPATANEGAQEIATNAETDEDSEEQIGSSAAEPTEPENGATEAVFGQTSEYASDDAAIAIDQPSEEPAPRPRAVFRDRRGARRQVPQKEETEPRSERRTSARLRQADAKLRLIIDVVRKRTALAAVLHKPEGFPDHVHIGQAEVQKFDDTRYDDLDLEWTAALLDGEIRLTDETQRLEWVRGARPFHLFAAASGESDLISLSAAPLGRTCTIVCREAHAADIEAMAAEAASPALVRLDNFEGVPAGWTVLEGYAPVQALVSPPEWLKPLDPGANTDISLHGGLEIRSAFYAEGEPPLIRIDGLPANCRVFIDETPAEMQSDGSWSAPGWDRPGVHLIDIDPGKSLTYHIIPDPGLRSGWELWAAHTALAPTIAGSAAVCGAMVFCPDGRTVLATEPASSVTALGVRQEIKMLTVRQDAPAAVAALPFEPLFAVLSSGGRKEHSKIIVLDFPRAVSSDQPQKLDARWASKVRDMAARRVPIRPETPAAKAAWHSAMREARRWKRSR